METVKVIRSISTYVQCNTTSKIGPFFVRFFVVARTTDIVTCDTPRVSGLCTDCM